MSSALLPGNATPFEKTLVDSGSAFIDALAPDYSAYFDPATCPEDALPFLAHTLGLPIWREEWSTPKKRQILTDWPIVAGKLGTEDALRWAVSIAEGNIVTLTVPPQGFYLAGSPDENEVLWNEWLHHQPEIRLINLRQEGIEVGYLGELDFPDEVAEPGMFLGDEEDVATFFTAVVLSVAKAVIIRDDVETEIAFERLPDPRWKRNGEIINFYWPGTAGLGLFCDDAGSSDYFLDGLPPVKLYASVSFGYGSGVNWSLVAPVDRVQDVKPELGWLYDEDGIGLFADDFWLGQFLDEIDPMRGTYQSFRIIEEAANWQPPGSYLDWDRFSMDYHTAEVLTAIPGIASAYGMILNYSFLDATYGLPDAEFPDIELLAEALTTTRAHRDDIYIDLDIPARNSLRKLSRLSDLSLN